MLTWNTIDDHDGYNSQRFQLLKLLEGSTSRPYVDAVGDPTIGIGFNLVYNLEPVLKVILGGADWNDAFYKSLQKVIAVDYGSGDTATLLKSLDKVMAAWHLVDPDVPSKFAFENDAQIAEALDATDDYYDSRIDDWVANIPESSERAALFSLCWNAPSMLGPKLQAAIESGDRAEAWYEIRYNSLSSSLPDSLKAAIANRRYVEADMFSLFQDEAKATYAEAVDAGRMLAAHHEAVLGYEAAYDPLTAATIKGVKSITAITEELQPAADAILNKFRLHAAFAVEEVLATAKGQANLTGDGTSHDSTANDDDLLLGDTGANGLVGGAGRDILIALKGRDILTGGTSSDLFVFTSIRDSGISGKGDLITDFANGDQIALTGKTEFSFLDGRNAAFSGTEAEIRWFWSKGNTVVEADYDGNGTADLHVMLAGKHSLTIDDFAL